MFGRVCAIIALALLQGTPAFAAGSDEALRAAMQQSLNSYVATYAKSEHISAASLSVSLPGEPRNINLTAGRRSWQSGGPVAADDLWQIGSNTKAFTAAALLQLEAEGKLNIDQTIGDWLPQYPAWKSVTIRRLLDMTSGIQGYDNVPAMSEAWTTIHRRFTPEQLVGFADPIYPNAPKPTHGWNYSNTNYMLAGMIIERASGHSATRRDQAPLLRAARLDEHILQPERLPEIRDRSHGVRLLGERGTRQRGVGALP